MSRSACSNSAGQISQRHVRPYDIDRGQIRVEATSS